MSSCGSDGPDAAQQARETTPLLSDDEDDTPHTLTPKHKVGDFLKTATTDKDLTPTKKKRRSSRASSVASDTSASGALGKLALLTEDAEDNEDVDMAGPKVAVSEAEAMELLGTPPLSAPDTLQTTAPPLPSSPAPTAPPLPPADLPEAQTATPPKKTLGTILLEHKESLSATNAAMLASGLFRTQTPPPSSGDDLRQRLASRTAPLRHAVSNSSASTTSTSTAPTPSARPHARSYVQATASEKPEALDKKYPYMLRVFQTQTTMTKMSKPIFQHLQAAIFKRRYDVTLGKNCAGVNSDDIQFRTAGLHKGGHFVCLICYTRNGRDFWSHFLTEFRIPPAVDPTNTHGDRVRGWAVGESDTAFLTLHFPHGLSREDFPVADILSSIQKDNRAFIRTDDFNAARVYGDIDTPYGRSVGLRISHTFGQVLTNRHPHEIDAFCGILRPRVSPGADPTFRVAGPSDSTDPDTTDTPDRDDVVVPMEESSTDQTVTDPQTTDTSSDTITPIHTVTGARPKKTSSTAASGAASSRTGATPSPPFRIPRRPISKIRLPHKFRSIEPSTIYDELDEHDVTIREYRKRYKWQPGRERFQCKECHRPSHNQREHDNHMRWHREYKRLAEWNTIYVANPIMAERPLTPDADELRRRADRDRARVRAHERGRDRPEDRDRDSSDGGRKREHSRTSSNTSTDSVQTKKQPARRQSASPTRRRH